MAEQFARERLPEEQPVENLPVLTLGECIDMYWSLREQAQLLDEQVRALREQILEVMSQHNIGEIHHGRFEAVRQVRRTAPKLDVERAVELLKRHNRLRDCLVERLDEAKARQVLEELRSSGAIGRRELPLEPARTVEALIVRPIEGDPEEASGQ